MITPNDFVWCASELECFTDIEVLHLLLRWVSPDTPGVAGSVRDTCASRLLQAWLRYCGGNALDLLTCLDVESSADVSAQAMESLFKKAPVTELLSNFDLLTDE